MQAIAITNQPFPFNLTHRRPRRSHLPSHHRSNPYAELSHDHHH